MNLDIKIKGATIVDGSGRQPFRSDLGIKDGLIVDIGKVSTQASREINAEGALLTPGFIDPHTHYDGQAFWDDELLPSTRHGVTTAFLGNCGVGFAPLVPGGERDLITLMTGVEDVPESVLQAGLDWDWDSFSDYLDRLSERHWPIDIGTQVTHDPVRICVMGERGMNREPATQEDIKAMRDIVSAALGAGAYGFSTGRNDAHRMSDGRDTPASLASETELLGITECLKDHGHRILQLTSDFDMNSGDENFEREFRLIERMAETAGRPISLNLVQRPGDHDLWHFVMDRAKAAKAKRIDISLQVAPRGVGILMGLATSFHPFVAHPSFQDITNLPLERCVKVMRDPEFKSRILAENPKPYAGKDNAASDFHENLLQNFEEISASIFPVRGVPNFEPSYSDSLQADAYKRGISAIEAAYDALLEMDGNATLYWPAVNYGSGNLDYVREMLLHPKAIMGLGDAGAHLNSIADYSYSTFALSFWPSKRKAGPGLPVEHVVHMMTGSQARYFGLHDRGLIEVGKRADLNLIDQSRLGLKPIQVKKDLPSGGRRILVESEGYILTMLGGEITVENDELTGLKPGSLIRAS